MQQRGAPVFQAPPVGRRTLWRTRSRWVVHLALMGAAVASIGTLQLLHVRIAYHAVVGLVFVGLVLVHLVQRRHTLARLATGIARATERKLRMAVSDLVLLLLSLNVLVSGIVDWGRGEPAQVPLPKPFFRWHLDAGLVLVVYLTVHVWRRRRRLRRSTIR